MTHLKRLAADPNMAPSQTLKLAKANGHPDAGYMPHQGQREIQRRTRQRMRQEEKTGEFKAAAAVADEIYSSLVSRDTTCPRCGATSPELCEGTPHCNPL